ncbi:MAG: NUDIX domain-containing protein [Opitutales bacterium]|nr:NUDIX domain-containing protein [Opitutales bacterium]
MGQADATDVAEEWLDIVDAGDRVTGRGRRGIIHREGLMHRAVHILLRDAAGRYFVQRRSFAKDTFPGRWDSSASGHVDAGEDYDTAMRRELGEELGWSPENGGAWPRRILRFTAQPLTGNEFVRVYTGVADGPLQPDPSEIIDGRWLSPAAIDAWLAESPDEFADAFRLIWPAFRQVGRS